MKSYWKRSLLAVALLLVAFSFLYTFGSAHAQSSQPYTTSVCSSSGGGPGECEPFEGWSVSPTFGLHGWGSTFTVDNPGGAYTKYIEVFGATNNGYEEVGITKGLSCGSSLHYFYQNDKMAVPTCEGAVPTADINTVVSFTLTYFASSGGGGFAYIYSSGNACDPPTGPCSFADSNLTGAFQGVGMHQILSISSFSGHQVWGGRWIDNEYFAGGAFTWAGTGGNFTGAGGTTTLWNDNGSVNFSNLGGGGSYNQVPGQMYWNSPPNGSANSGGDLRSCDYDTTLNSCTLGS